MLISEDYRKEQERLHQNPNYGVASLEFAPIVSQLINQSGIDELLDYGAGKCRLFGALQVNHGMKLQAYDPGVKEFSGDPIPMQMVTCIDVLEHIEPDNLDSVLDHLKSLILEVGFFTIHTGPAIKTLSDGRNAHLIQQPSSWWLPRIQKRFDLHTFQRTHQGFFVVVKAKDESHGDW
jgi:hypothetical protein